MWAWGVFFFGGEALGILAQLERGIGRKQREAAGRVLALPGMAGLEAPRPERFRDLTAAYRVHPWVYAAVRAIAMAAGDVPIVAMRVPRKLGVRSLQEFKRLARIDKWEEVIPALKAEGAQIIENHPALALLEDPLPQAGLTRHELIQVTVTYLELEGEAYWEMVFADGRKTKLAGLWPKIDPRYVWVIPGDDRLIAGYVYRKGTRTVVFSSDEMIQFQYFHPESPYYGLSPTEVLRTSILADVKAVDWNRIFFENDATPGFSVSTDQKLTREEVETLQTWWEVRHRGANRAHRLHIFHSGLKPIAISPTHRDMQFERLRAWTRDEILAAYGVPPIVVGLYKDANRAAAQTMRRLFYENTVIPRLGKIESILNRALLKPDENVRLFFDVSAIEALQEDLVAKAEMGKQLMAQGWTPNEIREFWGKPRAEGEMADSIYIPSTMIAAGTVKPRKQAHGVTKQEKRLAGDPEDFLPPPEETLPYQEAVHREYLPGIALVGAEWGASVLERIGHELPPDWASRFHLPELIERWTDEHMGELIKQVDDVTRQEIVEVIREGMREGYGPRRIASMMREKFDWMSEVRAERIARTEAGKAVAYGQHELYRQAGVERKRWLATLDSRVRDIHAAAHMQERAIDEPFEVGGELLMHPRDPAGSGANVINCRCTEQPISARARSLSKEEAEKLWWDWDAWLKGVEGKQGEEYRKALSRFFHEEGERYVNYLYQIVGSEE